MEPRGAEALPADPALVEADIEFGRIDEGVAREAYGVVPGDVAATARLREEMRRDRLAGARPALKPLSRDEVTIAGDPLPLYPGVIQYEGIAVAEASGAPLAVAPDHWTAGCPALIEHPWGGNGPDISYRSWLDPETGRALHVEAVVDGDIDSFYVAPSRWVEANTLAHV
jgi:N-methylhydantoinase B